MASAPSADIDLIVLVDTKILAEDSAGAGSGQMYSLPAAPAARPPLPCPLNHSLCAAAAAAAWCLADHGVVGGDG